MSKKAIILNYFREGKSVEEIEELGFNKKYIKQVIRQSKDVTKENGSCKGNSLNEDKVIDNEKYILKNINEMEKFLYFIKNRMSYVNDIKVSFTVNWNSNNKKNVKKDKEKSILNFNPLEIYRNNGSDGLRERLIQCSIEELRSIVKTYAPDPRGYVNKWTNKEKVLEYIIERIEHIADNGKAFYTV